MIEKNSPEDLVNDLIHRGKSLACDEDGFVTLTDKEGNSYVARTNKEERDRYESTGKPLSKVKKEKTEKAGKSEGKKETKETEKKPAEVVELHPEIKKVNKTEKAGIFSELYGRGETEFEDVLTDIYKQENATDPRISDEEIKERIEKSFVNSPAYSARKEKAEELMSKVKNESWYKELARDLGGNFAKMARYYLRKEPNHKYAGEMANKIDDQIHEIERYLKNPKQYKAEGEKVQKELKELQNKLREKTDYIRQLPRSRENTTAYNKASKAVSAIYNGTSFDVRPVTSDTRFKQEGINTAIVEATTDLTGLEKMRDSSKKLLSSLNKKYSSSSIAQDSALEQYFDNLF